jgi:hypothetical protein
VQPPRPTQMAMAITPGTTNLFIAQYLRCGNDTDMGTPGQGEPSRMGDPLAAPYQEIARNAGRSGCVSARPR